jgi:hydroxyacylglutathione hydrolase
MPLAVARYPLGPFQANCYVVRATAGAADAAVVDPGAQGADLRLELARTGARCAGILVTHTDVDHIGAVAELAEGTGAEVWCPAGEADVLRDPSSVPRAGGVPAYEPEHLVAAGATVEVAGISFEVVDVPGHSSGHVAYHAASPEGAGCLFSGDLLFAGSVGRVDLTGGDWETLLASIARLFERFPPETVVYSGHGPETTLAAERATNPYLAELRVS